MVLVHFNTLEELPAKIKAAQTKVPNFKSILITGMSDGEKTDKIATALHRDLEQHGVVTVVIPKHMRVEAVRKSVNLEAAIDNTPSVAEIAHHLNQNGFNKTPIVVFGVNHINLDPIDLQRLIAHRDAEHFTYYGYDGNSSPETKVNRLNRVSLRRGSKIRVESDLVRVHVDVMELLRRFNSNQFRSSEQAQLSHLNVNAAFNRLYEQCPGNCSILIWNTATPATKEQGNIPTPDVQNLGSKRSGKVQFSEVFTTRPKLTANALGRFLANKAKNGPDISSQLDDIFSKVELSEDDQRLEMAKVLDARAPSLSARYFLEDYLSSLPRGFNLKRKSIGRLGIVRD